MKREKPLFFVTVDAVVFSIMEQSLKILLIKRGKEPYKNMFALPGGYVEEEEELEAAVHRELKEETGVKNIYLEQVGCFGSPSRDPRGRTVSIAYMALIDHEKVELQADTDAESAEWYDIHKLPKLAFDHNDIIKQALAQLQANIGHTNLAFQLLPELFTLTHLQQVHEAILNTELDKRNFRKKLLSEDLVEETDKKLSQGRMRPARLYKFKR